MSEPRAPYDAKLEVRCYRGEKTRLQRAAEARGVSTSELVRMQLGTLIGYLKTANASPGGAAGAATAEPASADDLPAPAAPPGGEPSSSSPSTGGSMGGEGGENPAADASDGHEVTLMELLASRTGVPRSIVRKQIAAGRVKLDGRTCDDPDRVLSNVCRVALDGGEV